MEAKVASDVEPTADVEARIGWILGALGLAGVAWWVWTWSNVQRLIDDHVSTAGALPISPMDRSSLSASGTPAERQLSSDLTSMSGLYPWGPLPLVLAGLVAVTGFILALRHRRTLAAIGIGVTVVLVVVAATLFGESMTIALDILE